MAEPRSLPPLPLPTLPEASAVWARIGLLSFGGPAGQIALMHRELVEQRRWVDEGSFLHALNFCMLLPGPEAQQLATYIGWRMHGVGGGIIAGSLFILPGFLAILALSILYVTFGEVPAVDGLLFGLRAAVIAIIAQALIRLGKRVTGNRQLFALAAAAFLALFLFAAPFPLVILAAALIGFAAGRAGNPAFLGPVGHGGGEGLAEALPPRPAGGALRAGLVFLALWLVPVAALVAALGPGNVFADLASFFSKLAVLTFGGAYAVLAWVAQAAVDQFGWLQPGEMLDGLAFAETTPGPLILVLQFVGFLAAFRDPGSLDPLLAGLLGSVLTIWVTFLPCYAWIFLGAPHAERLRSNAALSAALTAVGAAVVGVIANLALWFALHSLFAEHRPSAIPGTAFDVPVLASANLPAILLAAAAVAAALRFKLGPIPLLAGCGLAGLALGVAGLS
ncbi:MAG: chromate efflux transporter [Sandaracinobacteroides sp.]